MRTRSTNWSWVSLFDASSIFLAQSDLASRSRSASEESVDGEGRVEFSVVLGESEDDWAVIDAAGCSDLGSTVNASFGAADAIFTRISGGQRGR